MTKQIYLVTLKSVLGRSISHYSCKTNIRTNFKTAVLKSSLYDYSDAYILFKETITITGAGADAAARLAY